MTHRSRLVAVLTALIVVAAACGGDASTADPAPVPAATAAPDTGSPAGDGPNATVSPELPEALVGEVGPVEVIGDPLPELGRGTPVADDPALGVQAPVLVGQDFDGSTVRVDAAADGPTLVVFLAHWCPHCNAEVPRLNELRDAGSFPEGLNLVAVSTAIDPTRPNWPPSRWFDDIDWTYPVIADGVDMQARRFIAATAFGVDGFPFVTLVNADGTVAARWSGEHETAEILTLITSNLAKG